MSFELNKPDQQESHKLAKLVRELNTSGHNPATSGNYSLRMTGLEKYALVSESGIDKAQFQAENFLPVHTHEMILHPSFKDSGRKSSDETDIHLAIYRSTNANCVLHSHLLEAILFADLYPAQDYIQISGMELLKAFRGITTHESTIEMACFENTQDIRGLSVLVEQVLKERPQVFGVMLRQHGLYVWGETVKEAKKHLEVFEYLFKYFLQTRRFQTGVLK